VTRVLLKHRDRRRARPSSWPHAMAMLVKRTIGIPSGRFPETLRPRLQSDGRRIASVIKSFSARDATRSSPMHFAFVPAVTNERIGRE